MIILNRREMSIIMIILIFTTALFYYYVNRLQNNYQNAQYGEERCALDLEQAKYQLAVVSDYKNRIEKLLTETKKSNDNDKTRYRDIMDSCVAMKQQCVFCQSQFEDLQAESKVVREQLNQALLELNKYKTDKTGG